MDNSLMFMMVMNIGAVIGIVGGRSFSRSLPFETCADVLGHDGCCCNELDGLPIESIPLYILVFLAGAASIGSQMLLYSYVAQYYPLAVRSTGIGWSSAIGRMGAIIGPILIGSLLGMNFLHTLTLLQWVYLC